MMKNNHILVLALLALSSCVSTVTGNQRKFMRLAKCFDDTTYPTSADTLACLGNVSTCFDETTVETVKTCIQDGIDEAVAAANATTTTADGTRFLAGHNAGGGGFKNRTAGLGDFDGNGTGFGSSGGFRPQKKGKMGKLAGIVQGCLEEYKDCIKEEVRAFIAKLPACVNTTTVALGQCYKTNAETCASSCSTADIPDSNPFQGISSTTIKLCNGFQNQIMDPSCEIVECCPQCTTEFDELMTCVGQDLLQLKPEPCELSCPTARRRLGEEERREHYVMRKLAGHLPAEPDAVTVADECAVYLDTDEETITADAVAEKILDGEFIGCVADVAILVAEEQKEYVKVHNTGGGGDTTSAGNPTMAVSTGLVAVLSLGLVRIM
mmetsp:Transcript_4286/g.10003  ORF Transcript_4286/g.10003 Transcript_4286/m.10003 type:complete len:380 (+) Transcript_4286:1880-3019(+)